MIGVTGVAFYLTFFPNSTIPPPWEQSIVDCEAWTKRKA